jgi:hypothetical protein
MKVSPMIQAARERKIEQVIAATGCARDHAIAYLFAEEWFVADAIASHTVDAQICAHRDQRIETRDL